ncbi:DUF2249 domain-containing protein [Bosea sp. (in: a-proteobacteria)]|uniref:DUF2249 domain-containing protein n=1 Tax=Bosea sp. (in: a-proteobacteria) TaxID=1871050 RepID=UPI0012190A3D|nr:DUF2249 domain-containing protein [Bosea sp. (in: a-proteobacteria)]TAJ27641.1 MAG: DUF2249 domain-containing protein [Bosea sp. (in: a-proteobacteria)]
MTIPTLAPLDVRAIPPGMRHATIFGILERLEPGESFRIVNDHDPAPLHHQIDARWPEIYSWSYVAAGPDVWQVEIARNAAPAGDADCGGHDAGHACTCGH